MTFTRGKKMLVVVTNEVNKLVKADVNVDGIFADKQKLCDQLGDGTDCVTVSGTTVSVQIGAGADPKIYMPSQ